MWTPERVWEQSLVSDIAAAGIEYTLLDDFHFKAAGLTDDSLTGHYLTEENGSLLNVFPGSERLRYLIPFADPHETIDYLRNFGEQHPGAVVAFGDDGEKFGVWPETKVHVYDNGWLRRFFDALNDNQEWLHTTTPSHVIDTTAPVDKLYIPEGSYREMTEWVLPATRIEQFDALHHDFEAEGKWHRVAPFVRGGYWRNFKVKYPETNEMYCRMQMVSRRIQQAAKSGLNNESLLAARKELYRGQCNCSYWHGAFGGVYLPHLRNAVYNHLIAADNILDEAEGRGMSAEQTLWVEATASDYNFDGRQELSLSSNRLLALLAPSAGGMMYELDVRPICLNVLATLARRHEGYHHKVLSGPTQGDNVASIHDRVVFKQEGLDQKLQYDSYERKSLIDHFYTPGCNLREVAQGEAIEQGDFVHAAYEAKIRRSPDRVQILMSRQGTVAGNMVQLTKGITLSAGGASLEIAYLLEGLPQETPLHLAIEFNFAGLPGGQEDRFFRDEQGNKLGQLDAQLDLDEVPFLGLVDGWQGLEVGLAADRSTSFWAFPIETVSQSEGGFELVHQSVAVVPHWIVLPDENGQWSVTMQLTLDTAVAEKVEPVLDAVASAE